MSRLRIVSMAFLFAAAALVPAASGQSPDEPPENPKPEKYLIDDVAEVEAARAVAPKYWLGIVTTPVPELLRRHLGLGEDDGLLVRSVVPDSPAAKAGIEESDILVAVNDQALPSTAALVAAIRDSEGKRIAMKWLHRGQEVVKEVTPVERPSEYAEAPLVPDSFLVPPGVPNAEELKKLLGSIHPSPGGEGQGGAMRLRFFGPGVGMKRGLRDFPGNLKLQISRQNDEPATIVVERGEERWEVTEDTLDKLPEDIRGYVQGMLAEGPEVHAFQLPPGQGPPMNPDEVFPGWREIPKLPEIQKQFDEMNRRMDEMMEQLREMHEGKESKKENIDA